MTTRTVLGALSAVSLLALTGCGSEPLAHDASPGAAATVGDVRVEIADVDSLARRYCDFVTPQLASGEQAVPMGLVRNSALNLLVLQEVADQYAEATDLEVTQAAKLLRQQAEQQAIQSQVPEEDRDTYYQVSMQLDTQAIYLAAGGRDAFAEGTLPEQDAVATGSAMVQEWAADLAVNFDPRFADLRGTEYDVNATSLATPSTALAKLAAEFDPAAAADPAYLASLPASQKCG